MAAALPLLLLLSAALLRAFAGAQDFDLADALDDPKKPAPTPRKPPGGGGDLDLNDALGGLDPPPPRPRDPQKPDARPAGGDFSDTDLQDGTPGRGRGDGPRGGGGDEEPQPEGSPQGLVPGLVAAAMAALAGAVSSFVAYQKRKFCFREAGPAPV